MAERGKGHEARVVIFPPIVLVPLEYNPQPALVIGGYADVGISVLWIASVPDGERGELIIMDWLEGLEEVDCLLLVGGWPTEVGGWVMVWSEVEEVVALKKGL